MKVSRLLELMQEFGATENDHVHSVDSAPFGGFHNAYTGPWACMELKEVEIMTDQLISPSFRSKIENPKAMKIVVLVCIMLEDLSDSNPLHSITISDFKQFLETIQDQSEKVYISFYNNGFIPVINAHKKEENIFYLWF